MPNMVLPYALESLTPREAVADAVSRVIQAFDINDVELFESGLTTDVVVTIGDKVYEGRDTIRKESFDMVGKMDTSHFVTNQRIHIKPNGTEAQMTANALSQHFPPGEGLVAGAPNYLVGARYEVDLVKDGSDGLWKVKTWVLTPVWTQGDASIMHAWSLTDK